MDLAQSFNEAIAAKLEGVHQQARHAGKGSWREYAEVAVISRLGSPISGRSARCRCSTRSKGR